MAKGKAIISTQRAKPKSPTTQPGQRGVTIPNYFFRFLPLWNTPSWFEAERWRRFARNQPLAMICRDRLTTATSVLDWKVESIDPDKADEQKDEIKYYTKFFDNDGNFDFSGRNEFVCGDMLDLPFGSAVEVGRQGDNPDGRILWMEPLDGGTLFPTLNKKYPVAQLVSEFGMVDPIPFPAHAINRVYCSPRQDIQRKGWGMAPPEKIYLAMELLWRGDQYYANLLLDTPEAGLLDLGDMAEDDARSWIESFRNLMSGIDAFKIPVLYQHEKPVSWIPFGRPPTDMLFDKVSVKYAAMVTAGYGLTLTDAGLSLSMDSGGNTLAGKIRDERSSRQNGFAVMRKKMSEFYNNLLRPQELKFSWIISDEEISQTQARTRMANAQAFSVFIDKGIFDAKELRRQAIADGLVTVSVGEEPPEPPEPPAPKIGNPKQDVVDQLERPVPPEMGGHGDIKERSEASEEIKDILFDRFKGILENLTDVRIRRLIRMALAGLLPSLIRTATKKTETEAKVLRAWIDDVLNEKEPDIEGYVGRALDTVATFVGHPPEFNDWWRIKPSDDEYERIFASYRSWFDRGAAKTLRSVTEYLYEHNFIDHTYLPPARKSDNAVIAALLLSRAKKLIADLNDGTETFLHQALYGGIKEVLLSGEELGLLRDGIDIETIMSNNATVERMIKEIRSRIRSTLLDRVDLIEDHENSWATNYSVIEELGELKLQKKQWKHYGTDEPCILCQKNIAAGIVPLDFKYETVFGASENGPGHPWCHCGVSFVPDEIQNLVQTGIFPIKIWRGVINEQQ